MITFRGRLKSHPGVKLPVPAGVRTVVVGDDGALAGNVRAMDYVLELIDVYRREGFPLFLRPTVVIEPDPTDPVVLSWACAQVFNENVERVGDAPSLNLPPLPEGAIE